MQSPELSAARCRIDPKGELPQVTFRAMADYDQMDGLGLHAILLGERLAGQVNLCEDERGWHFGNVWVRQEKPYWRQGIGRAAYLLAIETAHAQAQAFCTDSALTPQAASMWARFVDAEIVEVVRPLCAIRLRDLGGQISFRGDLRMHPDLHT